MTVKPGQTYKGKVSGEFTLERIAKENGQPVFYITTAQHPTPFALTLVEMREELK